jgi:hypothetical protein
MLRSKVCVVKYNEFIFLLLLSDTLHHFSSHQGNDTLCCGSDYLRCIFNDVFVEKQYWTDVSDSWDNLHLVWTNLEVANKSATFEESPQYREFRNAHPGHKGESITNVVFFRV